MEDKALELRGYRLKYPVPAQRRGIGTSHCLDSTLLFHNFLQPGCGLLRMAEERKMIGLNPRHLDSGAEMSCPFDHPLLAVDWHYLVIFCQEVRNIPLLGIQICYGRHQCLQCKRSQR